MKRILAIFSAFVALAACQSKEDLRVTTTGPVDVTLTASGDVVLAKEDNSNLALTLNWTDNNNIPTVGAAAAPHSVTVNSVQFSGAPDFVKYTEQQVLAGDSSVQFTVERLNTIAGKAGLAAGVKSTLYIRLASVLGPNMTPKYSNVVTVQVTPYALDMSILRVLDKDRKDTGLALKQAGNGTYAGFLSAVAWFNWWGMEGNGTEWGNLGVDGKPFFASTASDKWNFWFPGVTGSYYVILDTKNEKWSALLLPSLSVSGDVTGVMTFDKATNRWLLPFSATAGTMTVNISGTGKQYDTVSGTDDGKATDTPLGFGGEASAVTFGSAGSDISVSVPSSGQATLVLDLSAMTISVEAGESGPAEVPQLLYMSGVDDGLPGGKWTFDNYLTLYDEDNLSYAGACNINSLWGYLFYVEKDNWDDKYGLPAEGENTPAAGKLEHKSDNNVPAPEPGLYLMTASLKGLSYTTAAISSVQIAGVGKDTGWELLTMNAGETPGVYTLSIAVEGETPWGFKIYVNDSWDVWFGGSDGILRYGADGCPLDASYAGSTCLFTIDLCKGTYKFEKQ